MTLALDTSILIDISRGDIKTISKLKKLIELYPFSPQIAFITHFEFLFGLKSRKPKKYKEALAFLNKFNVLHITIVTSEILSDLKLKYSKEGIVLSLADLLIASQIIENNLTLVTKDKDFKKIKELKKIIF